jgi:hypothetical protein
MRLSETALRAYLLFVMSSGVETSLNISEIIRDSSTSVGMTKNPRLTLRVFLSLRERIEVRALPSK